MRNGNASFTIYAFEDFVSSSQIRMEGNIGLDSMNRFYLWAGRIQMQDESRIDMDSNQDELYLRPTCLVQARNFSEYFYSYLTGSPTVSPSQYPSNTPSRSPSLAPTINRRILAQSHDPFIVNDVHHECNNFKIMNIFNTKFER